MVLIGDGQHFAATTDELAEIKAALLWSIGTVIYEGLSAFASPAGTLGVTRMDIVSDKPLGRSQATLKSLALLEQRLMSLRGMASPQRFEMSEFEHAIYSPLWARHKLDSLADTTMSEIESLVKVIEANISADEKRRQRLLNLILYFIALFGGLNAIGELVDSMATGRLLPSIDAAQLKAWSQIALLSIGLVVGGLAFRH